MAGQAPSWKGVLLAAFLLGTCAGGVGLLVGTVSEMAGKLLGLAVVILGIQLYVSRHRT
jgi:hypothetical protein